jgi:PadR family transcriptional regulator PadR
MLYRAMAKVNLSLSATAILQALAHGYKYGFDIMDVTGLPSGTV